MADAQRWWSRDDDDDDDLREKKEERVFPSSAKLFVPSSSVDVEGVVEEPQPHQPVFWGIERGASGCAERSD